MRGSTFDAHLVLGSGGWTPADQAELANRSRCRVRLYDFSPLSVDGATGALLTAGLRASTLHVSLAEFAGLRAAAYHLVIAGRKTAWRRRADAEP